MKLQLWLNRASLIFFFVGLSSLSVLAQANTVPARVTRPANLHNLVTLRGNVHPLARPEYDQGLAPDDLPMERMLLVLQRGADQEAALRQMLDQQQVKSSPQFHHWLTPEQFGQQFGPNDSDLQAVIGWLVSQGFQVAKASPGRTVIEFSGSAGLVRQVLGTEIHKFRVSGEDYWANTSDPQIPVALAPVVAGFASLNNFPRRPLIENVGTVRRSEATAKLAPLFTYPIACAAGVTGTCDYDALGPADFATIYNVNPLWDAGTDGTGQTIAVVAESNINLQNATNFRTMFGLPASPPKIILNGPDPGINVWDEVEANLDVQWAGAVARGATIDLVVSQTTETTAGIDLSALYIVDNNLAPILSESYGTCEAELGVSGNQFYNTLWEQAAAQGITVLMASGDSGPAACNTVQSGNVAASGLAVTGNASTPFDVAVGGTDFNDTGNLTTYWNTTNASPLQSSAKSYIPETAWTDSCAASGLLGCTPVPSLDYLYQGFDLVAGGGGPSSCTSPSGSFPFSITCSGGYPKPSWQSGPGVPNDNARDVPDVSLFAGNGTNSSIYVFCDIDYDAGYRAKPASCNLNSPYQNFLVAGGTSVSAQAFAGVMAMVNQRHGRQGNANYVLYPLAAQKGATCVSNAASVTNPACIFYDVTTGSNAVVCYGGQPNCSNTSTESGQYGITVSGSLPAYLATPGYDLATGLGSINVANLVNGWKSNFTATTTTLSLSTNPPSNPITLRHGQPLDFTISVSSANGAPTGDVSLIASAASNTTGIGPFTLSGGNVSSSTTMLPSGSYNLTAHFAGNGAMGTSDSSPGIPVTVDKESSATELRTVIASPIAPPVYDASTVPYGSFYLRVDVTNSSNQLCTSSASGLISYLCPTGGLIVSPAPIDVSPPPGVTPGQFTLNSQGYGEAQNVQQSPGTYSFVASYSGDNSYTASTSPAVPITITQAPTTTMVSGSSLTAVRGGAINQSVYVDTTSKAAAPTGTIQLLANGNAVPGSAANVYSSPGTSTGYAVLEEFFPTPLPLGLAAGPVTLVGQYSGDSNYAGSTSQAVTMTITDFSMVASPTAVSIPAPGQSGTATISVAPLYGFSGTVALSVGSTCPTGATCTFSPGSVTLNNASAVTSILTIGTTAASNAPTGLPRAAPPNFRLWVGLFWWLAGTLVLAALLGSSATRRRPATLLVAATLLTAGYWVACGGGVGGGTKTTPLPEPATSFSPANLTFGTQTVGATSAAQSATMTNNLSFPVTVSGFVFSGTNSADFSETNNCPSTVAPGASCGLKVTFTPTAAGIRSATVSVNDNVSGIVQNLNLSGTGVVPPTPAGTYPVQVSGVCNSDGHSVTVNVIVQ